MRKDQYEHLEKNISYDTELKIKILCTGEMTTVSFSVNQSARSSEFFSFVEGILDSLRDPVSDSYEGEGINIVVTHPSDSITISCQSNELQWFFNNLQLNDVIGVELCRKIIEPLKSHHLPSSCQSALFSGLRTPGETPALAPSTDCAVSAH